MVIAVTDLFGIIPASRRSKKAHALGLSGGRYWKAFGITLAVSTVLLIILTNMGGSDDGTAAATPAKTVEPAATAATAKPAVTLKPTSMAKPAATTPAGGQADTSGRRLHQAHQPYVAADRQEP